MCQIFDVAASDGRLDAVPPLPLACDGHQPDIHHSLEHSDAAIEGLSAAGFIDACSTATRRRSFNGVQS